MALKGADAEVEPESRLLTSDRPVARAPHWAAVLKP